MGETIIEVVPVTWRKSLFKSESWGMVITNERLVFSKWTQELFNKEAQRRKEETKEEGGGKLKQFFSQMSASFTYWNKYYSMTPEEILQEHPENFSIYPKDVTNISLKRGRGEVKEAAIEIKANVKVGTGSDIDTLESPHELVITTNGEKRVFQFNKNFEKVKQALSGLFKL